MVGLPQRTKVRLGFFAEVAFRFGAPSIGVSRLGQVYGDFRVRIKFECDPSTKPSAKVGSGRSPCTKF